MQAFPSSQENGAERPQRAASASGASPSSRAASASPMASPSLASSQAEPSAMPESTSALASKLASGQPVSGRRSASAWGHASPASDVASAASAPGAFSSRPSSAPESRQGPSAASRQMSSVASAQSEPCASPTWRNPSRLSASPASEVPSDVPGSESASEHPLSFVADTPTSESLPQPEKDATTLAARSIAAHEPSRVLIERRLPPALRAEKARPAPPLGSGCEIEILGVSSLRAAGPPHTRDMPTAGAEPERRK